MWHVSNCLEYYNGQIHTSEVLLLLRVISNSPFLVEDVVAAEISPSDTRIPRISFRANRGYQHLEDARRKVLQYKTGTVFVGRVYLDAQYRKDRGAERDQLWLCFLASDVELVSAWIPLVNEYCVRRGINWIAPIPKQLQPASESVSPPEQTHMHSGLHAHHTKQHTDHPSNQVIAQDTGQPNRPQNVPQNGLQNVPQNEPQNRPQTEPQTANGSRAEMHAMILAIESLKLLVSEQESKFTSKTKELEAELTDLRLENKRLQSKVKGLLFLIERRTSSVKKMIDDMRN